MDTPGWGATDVPLITFTRMRQFTTGATRDDDSTKVDYEGFLSPLVVVKFGEYMTRHRIQADGGLRDSDNWQKGIPKSAYIKSMFRHFVDVWLHHRGEGRAAHETLEEALCGLLFNVQGYLLETLKVRPVAPVRETDPTGFFKAGGV